MTIIWVVRHGQASFGDLDYDVLSETGIEQSTLTGLFFKDTVVEFNAWYTGSMKRQIDTAGYARKEVGTGVIIKENRCFDEYNFKEIIKSHLDGVKKEYPSIEKDLQHIFTDNISFQRVYGKIMKRWISGNYDEENIETYIGFKKRVKEGLFSIAAENQEHSVLAVFTSGGVLSVIMQHALNLSDHEAMRLGWNIQNTSISKFKISNGRINLLLFNQMAHLENLARPELLTYR